MINLQKKMNQGKFLQSHLILAIVFGLFSCDLEDDASPERTITGTGPVVSKTLNLSLFDKIQHTGVANFYITRGDPQSAVLKAQQNIIDIITYKVVNSTFVVGLQENYSIGQSEEIRFDITVGEINAINLVGVGNFEFSGDFQDELAISLLGVGNVDAYDQEVGNCTIVSTGVGDCKVNVRDELDVTISGVGTVYYKGNPSITQHVTGLGQLVDDN